MTIGKKFKRMLTILLLCLSFTGQSAEIPLSQATEILQKIWHTLTTNDLVLNDISNSSDQSKDKTTSGNGREYLLHNGAMRWEVDRGYWRNGVGIFAAPPAVGWWYWQEDNNWFTSPTVAANKVFYLPFVSSSITHLIYGMMLPERLKSGQYTLETIKYHCFDYWKLTVVYPEPDSVTGRIPISHFYNRDQTLKECLTKILDERYPLTSEIPTGEKEMMLQTAEYYRYQAQFKNSYIKKIELTFDDSPTKPLLQGYAIYDCKNKKLVEKYWQVMEKREKFTDEYFLPPTGASVIRTTYESFDTEVLNSYGYGPGTMRKISFGVRTCLVFGGRLILAPIIIAYLLLITPGMLCGLIVP